MAAQQRQERFAQAHAGANTGEQGLTNSLAAGPQRAPPSKRPEEDLQEQLRILQEWICELLIKNQQLRESLASATNQRNQGGPQ
jgi:hypothetical protein